ncbi:ClbS/DfsB family four-helix bundle protein [Salipaludibacillus sp. HK11]|uniref:ClbS/DfsB family four-helix bundle protein n=1 Tax=Salipaludibacillus sp. HK11 TaxID=3394320 RepID=UPI0039FD9621
MGRPTSKEELIEVGNTKYKKLWELIDSLKDTEQNTTFDFSKDETRKEAHWARDKNLKDVLTHLYEWHQLLLKWINSNQQGVIKPFLPGPYNWRTYGDMNVMFCKDHQDTKVEDAKLMINESHYKVMTIIATFTNEELFFKGSFSWTGSTTLGSYCVSATASHYDWATKKLKAHIKNCKNINSLR